MFVLTIVVGDSASDRLAAAFRFGPLAKGADARLDAWITPPAYTGKAPLMLADGAYHHYGPSARAADRPAGPHEVPDRSVLIVRSSGGGALTLEVVGSDSQPADKLEAPTPANLSDVSELKYEVRRSGTVIVQARRHHGRQLAIPGHPRPGAQDLHHQGARAHATRRAEVRLQGGGRLRRRLGRDAHSPHDAQAGQLQDRLGPRRSQEGGAASL